MSVARPPLAEGRLGQHSAALEVLDGERVLLICDTSFAPGKPATLSLTLEPPLALALKTIGSKKRVDGRFEVRARIVTLTRVDRERLTALQAARAAG